VTTRGVIDVLRRAIPSRKVTRGMLLRAIDDGKIPQPMKNESGHYEWERYHIDQAVLAFTPKPKKKK
jgi:hypothetical protein